MSAFTSRLKLEKQVSGENSGTWGDLVNYTFNRLDAGIDGWANVNVAGSANVTLTSNNSTLNTDDSTTDDQVHNRTIEFFGALTGNINVFSGDVENTFTVFNNTTGSYTLTFGPTTGTGVLLKQGAKTIVYSDASTMVDVMSDLGDISATGLTVSAGDATISAGNTDITGDINLTGNMLATGNVDILTAKSLNFQDTTGGQYVGLKANGTVGSSFTLTLPTADGNADQALKTNGSGLLSFGDVAGGTSWDSIITADPANAAAGSGYFCNTSAAAFTVTLPLSPALGDEVSLVDYAGTFDTNSLTVGRNSQPIQGSAADLTVSIERAAFTLVYADSTQGWLLKDN